MSRLKDAGLFQSTYLYKVRLGDNILGRDIDVFQSTYLYKVRLQEPQGTAI